MEFLADMGVSPRVVEWLNQNGHNATHLRDEGLHRLDNGKIFKKAIVEKRVILTFDLDFSEITALSSGKKVSVIIFRLKNTRASNVIGRLKATLADGIDSLTSGAVVMVEETRVRVRHFPT